MSIQGKINKKIGVFEFMRPIIHLHIAFAALMTAPSVTMADPPQQKVPNIVFIMSDDHATRALSAYDDSLIQTPNIDRIANNGMRFDKAFVANSICGPSRATMLTGLHSHANGFVSNEWSGPFNGNQQTLPKLLQSAGYQTAVIGKWHLYSDPVGFDHWDIINNQFEQGSYYNPSFRSANGIEETVGYVADLVTDKALNWLQGAKQSQQPFFLIYNHKSPHRDWQPGPEELRNWNEQTKVEEPPTLLRQLDGLSQARQEQRMSIAQDMTNQDVKLSAPGNLTDEQHRLWEQAFAEGNRRFETDELGTTQKTRWKYQRYIKTYLASIKSMDRQIGRVLDFLEENDLMSNTVVVYTSDQGFFLGENGWFDKRFMDDVSMRTPLLMQWNNHIPKASQTDALVQNIDFAPTLLGLANIEPPLPMHGVSLLPLMEAKSAKWERDLYYHFYENPGFHGVARHYGIRTDRYKLIHYYRHDEWELFDLQNDPDEQANLYESSEYSAVVSDLKDRLNHLRLQYQVPAQDPEAPWYHDYMIRGMEQIMRWL